MTVLSTTQSTTVHTQLDAQPTPITRETPSRNSSPKLQKVFEDSVFSAQTTAGKASVQRRSSPNLRPQTR